MREYAPRQKCKERHRKQDLKPDKGMLVYHLFGAWKSPDEDDLLKIAWLATQLHPFYKNFRSRHAPLA